MSTNSYEYQNQTQGTGFPSQPAPQFAPQPLPHPAAPPPRQTKNKFLTFCCALIPGVGQMYHGLMRKGLSLMALFWGAFAIVSMAYIEAAAFLLPIIWFYSFFDTVNRMNMSLDELKALPDNYLFIGGRARDLSGEETEAPSLQWLFRERHLIIGWMLILAALWIILENLFGNWLGSQFWTQFLTEEAYLIIRKITRAIPSLFLPVFCILIGGRLILGDRTKSPRKARAAARKADEDSAGKED